MVEALSSYPSAQTCGFGCSEPHPKVFPIPHYLSLHIALDILSWLIATPYWIVQKCPKSPLCSCFTQEVWWEERAGPREERQGRSACWGDSGAPWGPVVWRAEAERGEVRKGLGSHGKGSVFHLELGQGDSPCRIRVGR